MQQAQASFFKRIGETLHVHYDEIVHAPLPERLLDLINQLKQRTLDAAQRSNTELHPAPDLIDKPEHWRKRAAEVRALAEQMSEPAAKRMMLGLAASYDRLARAATRWHT